MRKAGRANKPKQEDASSTVAPSPSASLAQADPPTDILHEGQSGDHVWMNDRRLDQLFKFKKDTVTARHFDCGGKIMTRSEILTHIRRSPERLLMSGDIEAVGA